MAGRAMTLPLVSSEFDRVEASLFKSGTNAWPGLMRHPWLVPFLLEAAAVGFEDAVIRVGFQLRERALTEMVDEAVLRGEDPEAGLPDPQRERSEERRVGKECRSR